MQYRFFWIPAEMPDAAAQELNRFLSQYRILGVEREFASTVKLSGWSVCVSYMTEKPADSRYSGSSRVDYREVLSEADFALYAECRTLRKELAEAEGIPAYAIFTNQQLAEIAQRRVSTLSALREIEGIGEGKAGKYGERFLAVVKSAGAPRTA